MSRRAGALSGLRPAGAVLALFVGLQTAPACTKGDGVVDGAFTVESQNRDEWVLFSFSDGDVLRDEAGDPRVVDDPSEVEAWDLAFSQWAVATNSGASASADSVSRGGLLAVEGRVDDWPSLAAFTARCSEFDDADGTANQGALGCNRGTPTVDDGWVADLNDDPDGAGPFGSIDYNPSVTFWFEYNFSGHEVLPYGNVYVVEAHDGRCAKLQLTDYYDETGESGFTSFSWEYLPD